MPILGHGRRTPDQQAAAERRDQLLEVAKVTEEVLARRMLQEQAEREAIRAGERRIYTEPWTASMRVRVSPLTPEINRALQGAAHLEIVDTLPDVTLEQGDDQAWYLTDSVHQATRERALLVMTDDQAVEYARRVLERYYRLVIPLRLAETAQLQGALEVVAVDGEGTPYDPGASGVIEVKDGARLMVRVTNQHAETLRVYTLNVASSGRCQVLGNQILQPREACTFASTTQEGEVRPWKLHPGRGRTFAIDRFVVLGTTSLYRELGALLQDEPLADILRLTRSPGGLEQDCLPDLEQWAASNFVFQITLP